MFKKIKRKKVYEKYSVLQALVRVVGFEKLDEVLPKVVDKRTLLQVTAKVLGFSEDLLLKSVADELKLPILNEISPVLPSSLPKDIDLVKLRRFGVIPVINSEKMIGLVCVDPELLKDANLDAKEIYLGTWKKISEALDASESYSEGPLANYTELELNSACEHIFQNLSSEIFSLGVTEYYFDFSGEVVRYTFSIANQKKGDGSIADFMTKPFEKYLSDLASTGGSKMIKDKRIQVFFEAEKERFVVALGVHNSEQEKNDENVIEFPTQNSSDNVNPDSNKKVEINLENYINELATFNPEDEISVLIVEDNLVFAKVIEGFLEKMSIKCIQVKNGSEAISMLNSLNYIPHLVISDLYMPIVDGFKLIENLKNSENFSQIKIVVLTSDEDDESELRAINLGADLVIRKSRDPRLLFTYISKILKNTISKKTKDKSKKEAA